MKFLYLLLFTLFLLSCSKSKPKVEKVDVSARVLEDSISAVKIEYINILKEIEDSNNTIEFNDKGSLISALLDKIQLHNSRVKDISTPSINKYLIHETKEILGTKINTLPSIDFKIQKCSGLIYLGCKVKFKPYIKDESTKLTHFWDFGDGITSIKRYPIHSFKKLGKFKVTMKVTDFQGGVSTLTKNLTVQNRAPVAKFELDDSAFSLNEEIYFYNKSYDLDGSIKKQYWNFGDKKSSTKKNPSHKYKSPGIYRVTLSVKDSSGKLSKSIKKITIKHPVDKEIEIGMKLYEVISLLGKPETRVEKSKSGLEAILYYKSWILLKKGLVECIVKEGGFKRNIFGSARECDWHKKNRSAYVVK